MTFLGFREMVERSVSRCYVLIPPEVSLVEQLAKISVVTALSTLNVSDSEKLRILTEGIAECQKRHLEPHAAIQAQYFWDEVIRPIFEAQQAKVLH